MITKIKDSIEKITCQKRTILEFLRSVKTHPTAEEIYKAVKKKLPQISRGTVYRNLKFLAKKGKILEIFSRVSHYDGDVSFHAHFICRSCDRIFDIFNVTEKCELAISEFRKKREITTVGEIEGYYLIFYGFCRRCKN